MGAGPPLNAVTVTSGFFTESDAKVFVPFQEMRTKYSRFLVPFAVEGNVYFISHRWRFFWHPDPDGVDFEKLREHGKSNPKARYWIDYCCLPQKPIDPDAVAPIPRVCRDAEVEAKQPIKASIEEMVRKIPRTNDVPRDILLKRTAEEARAFNEGLQTID